ncbi:hypothetical protein RA307_07495 [Xanthobacteraceae bacterium Astr-EGSB]|uniref:hypothetical protein n=1 Tax=Astrobacterium formosum TaxID=3069710 RepID=UPI0027B04CFE|nr:hypothetical protein [Xanthobacteraceae bacterium Astr-EGSB]
MPQLTRELLNELWARQEEREAARREQIRQAVAASAVPLPPELAQAVINLNDKYTRAILRDHPGYALAERRDSYLTSLAIMEQCLEDLLAAICVFENAALSEENTLFNPNENDALSRFERQIQKELFATANAAASLVDHARRVIKRHPLPEFKSKLEETFGVDGLHDFVIALRVMLHHLHMVEAGWNLTHSFSDGVRTATFMIQKDVVLRVIAAAPERFQRPTDAAMLAYVETASDSIDLRAVFNDYRARMARFHGWMTKELASDALIALRDYDRLIQEKVNSDQRMQWKALIGNWLNWKSSPDPHKHLPRFLSQSQLDETYKLPRNSKPQVDLIISYMDRNNACDDALRQQAYQLFERSPPPERE